MLGGQKNNDNHSILEISPRGKILNDMWVEFFKGIKYRQEVDQIYDQEMLKIARFENIAILRIENTMIMDWEASNSEYYDLRRKIVRSRDLYQLAKLIFSFCVARNISFECLNPTDETSSSNQIYNQHNRYHFRNESCRAILNYLVNGDAQIIKNFSCFEKALSDFYANYLSNGRIKFIYTTSNFDKKAIKKLDVPVNNFCPSVANLIHHAVKQIQDCNVIFLTSVSSTREVDLYENYGLGEFEGGLPGGYDYSNGVAIWDKPSQFEIKKEWKFQIDEWNKNYLRSLHQIASDYKKRIYLRVTLLKSDTYGVL